LLTIYNDQEEPRGFEGKVKVLYNRSFAYRNSHYAPLLLDGSPWLALDLSAGKTHSHEPQISKEDGGCHLPDVLDGLGVILLSAKPGEITGFYKGESVCL